MIRGGLSTITEDLHVGATDQNSFDLANSLRHAIEHDALSLHYQPMVRAGDGKVVGLEALVRWEEPMRGPVSPRVMLPIAEQFGLSAELGRWVIRNAVEQFSAWRRSGVLSESQLHVNLSLAELSDDALIGVVTETIERYQVRPQDLCLELTEADTRAGGETGVATMRGLSDLGVRFALDNFGIGSTIDVLTIAPFHYVKISRSLICGEDRPPHFRRLIRGILGLTRALEIEMIAEGVEHAEEVSVIAALGFSKIQGYALGRPSEAGDTRNSLIGDRAWLHDV